MADNTMKVRFYSRSATGSDMELLEEATNIPSQEQADALLRIYKETRGRTHPDRVYNYIVTQPLNSTEPTAATASKTYTELIADLLTGTVTAKMEHVPEKRSNVDTTYSRLILQMKSSTRVTDTNGYWDENPYYLTCFCFDFAMTAMVTTETKTVSSTISVIDAKVKMTDKAIINKGLNSTDYSKKPTGVRWNPKS